MDRDKRTLTDADVEAISDCLRKKLVKDFYTDLGKGIWGLAWRAILVAIAAVAAYGAVGNKFWK